MLEKAEFKISGMTCAACSARIERVLNRTEGVDSANVNLVTEKAAVDFKGNDIDINEIFEKVKNLGYEPIAIETAEETQKRKKKELDKQKYKFIISLILSLPLIYTMVGHFSFLSFLPLPHFMVQPWFQFILATPVQFILGWQFYKGAYSSLRNKSANMDVLVALGTSAAYFYSIYLAIIHYGESHIPLYFETSAVLITLILLGKYFEAKAKGHASDAINKLLSLQVKEARVERNGEAVEVPVDQVEKGDILLVKSGEYIPLDGEIIEGNTSIDESMLTGESIPVDKEKDDEVIGATLNHGNFIKVKVTQTGDDLVLNQIIRIVEEAQGEKPNIQRLADKISGIFVPTVLIIALIVFIVWFSLITPLDFQSSLEVFIAVIVIACPCALGLATPTSIMAGSGRAAELGVLFKSSESLEQTQNVDTIVFDKTGTLTEGHPTVYKVIDNTDNQQFGTLVKSMEQQSEHPLSQAITEYYADTPSVPVEHYQTHAGNGISGEINGQKIQIGSISFIKPVLDNWDNQIEEEIEGLQKQGATVVLAAIDKKFAGMIALRDEPKETAKNLIHQLRDEYDIIMLSGDTQTTAESIAFELGIEHVIAGVKPDDKANQIGRLQDEGKNVMMVGDGINDAPALAKSNIGLAMGTGSDIAIEAGDIMIVGGDIQKVDIALDMSKKTLKNIKENLFFAFCYNAIGIPVAAFGLLAPWIAGTAMAFSSVSVVLNALRLQKVKYQKNLQK
ncbi:heavy metal translocating P-type ATPase [Staphylococcus carnosus]|uniref:P-type Cu(+) transporter n=1 Tax=Staphylococcus carnosus (strain TM300) TaxID=396513 RepID=B9DMH3_STACT|nr:heavy metal translocating P-type ATPase [Staphylococcus carnosus]QPT04586.1 copper-translocating P-type ATPase [Staphylococcus carnosus]UQA67311.1 heavy metal translocating P-type ATPase [Staphylococcus carnosus]UTB77855.1 copper-translocating P-type ATPase [Staphylococcus carnosus]UTB87400.1 copper-translocating P-type ATPase [Staphylococcus carnosus]UTB89751.1 copper-translocating P-type ATPase [Staphylococcus carnosus]